MDACASTAPIFLVAITKDRHSRRDNNSAGYACFFYCLFIDVQIDFDSVQMPDIIHIFLDRTVRREFSGMRHI